MYCPSCGKAVGDSASFCDSCGRELSGLGSPGVMRPQPYQPTYEAPRYRQPLPGPGSSTPTHLGWAIVSLILFFWPTAIPAIVYAARVDNRLAMGDIAGAQEASRKAKTWCWVSTGIAIAGVVIAFVVLFILALVTTTIIF